MQHQHLPPIFLIYHIRLQAQGMVGALAGVGGHLLAAGV